VDSYKTFQNFTDNIGLTASNIYTQQEQNKQYRGCNVRSDMWNIIHFAIIYSWLAAPAQTVGSTSVRQSTDCISRLCDWCWHS